MIDSVGESVPTRVRLLVSVALGVLAGISAHKFADPAHGVRDFTLVWYGAGAVLRGQDPYALVGPGKTFEYIAPLYYPLPGLLVGIPFTPMSARTANTVFMVLGTALFAWALMARGMGALVGILSGGMAFASQSVQWTPLFAAAYVLPPIALAFAVKPHTGFAIFLAKPSWWAVIGMLGLTSLAFLVQPNWFVHWRASLAAGVHVGNGGAPTGTLYSFIVLMPGGFLVLAALTRWRRPEARLLVALACLPQSMLLYDSVPLALIPRGGKEAVVLVVGSYVALFGTLLLLPIPTPLGYAYAMMSGRVSVFCLYLPATFMILRRSNEGAVAAWLERLTLRWPLWIRGTAARP